MKYVLLIYQPKDFDPARLPREEHAAIAADYQAVTSTPGVTPGPPLGFAKNAITVRAGDGEPNAVAGPYAGPDAAIGGFMILEADTHDQAIALAARVPAVRLGGAVEVRPCEVYW